MYMYLDVTLLYSFNLCKTCLPVVVACDRYLQLLGKGNLCLETVHDDEAKVEWILAPKSEFEFDAGSNELPYMAGEPRGPGT